MVGIKMKIVETYSHLNGLEYLLVHKPAIWDEIQKVINNIDADRMKNKVSKEKTKLGKLLFSPKEMNDGFKKQFSKFGWGESRVSYYVSKDASLIRRTLLLEEGQQKVEIEKAGLEAHFSYNQTDFVKDRVAVEVQFGKYSFVAFDLFVKHLAFYVRDKIDVGVEILPMKSLQIEMSSGVGYYEGELYNLIREGRGVPAVPLVLIGIDA